MLTPLVKRDIKIHALSDKNEVCGVIVENINFHAYKCQNVSEHADSYFEISTKDYLKASKTGRIVASYHSQPSLIFSEADKINSNGHILPMIVYSTENDDFSLYLPGQEINAYIGKPFQIGYCDCLSLIQHYYLKEFNIVVGNYQRNEDWLKNPTSDYESHFEKEGFFQVSDLKKHDMIYFKFPNFKFVSHAAIYLGNETILHHWLNSYSKVEYYNGFLKKYAYKFLRHVRAK